MEVHEVEDVAAVLLVAEHHVVQEVKYKVTPRKVQSRMIGGVAHDFAGMQASNLSRQVSRIPLGMALFSRDCGLRLRYYG